MTRPLVGGTGTTCGRGGWDEESTTNPEPLLERILGAAAATPVDNFARAVYHAGRVVDTIHTGSKVPGDALLPESTATWRAVRRR